MEPKKSRADIPVIELTDRSRVKEQIRALKAGERIIVQRGDYVITVGVPSDDEESSSVETGTETSKASDWLE